ncbi:hypothetical protein [Streptomyces avermitilis]|uniref:hypothetical protein n=1 Tax=Streptomyces avermitilis TaxID=33903 RepID=UPI00382F8ED0
MAVVPFATPPAETTGGETVAAAVDRYLDSAKMPHAAGSKSASSKRAGSKRLS